MAWRRDLLGAVIDLTLRRGIPYWWRPRGFSMRPVIEDGDRVLVAPVEAARLRPGDIVKFQFGDELRMHRLVERREGRLIFRGDAADGEETVSASAVIGLAVAVERRGRVRRLRRRRGYWWLFAPGQRLGIFLQRRL